MKRLILLLLVLLVLASGCSPVGTSASLAQQPGMAIVSPTTKAATRTITPTPTATATLAEPTQIASASLTGTVTPIATLETFPVVSFIQNTNCRTGPGVRYFALLTYAAGATAQANGRNEDGSWISVRVPDQTNYCWVAISTVKPFGNVDTLRLIVAQTLPDTPTTITLVRDLCGKMNVVWISWTAVGSARGYRIYQDGQLMKTSNGADNQYYDNPKLKKATVFSVEAFNAYGVSNRIAITVPACK